MRGVVEPGGGNCWWARGYAGREGGEGESGEVPKSHPGSVADLSAGWRDEVMHTHCDPGSSQPGQPVLRAAPRWGVSRWLERARCLPKREQV